MNGQPKAFLPIAGKPLMAWSLEELGRAPEIDEVVVAAPAGMEPLVREVAGKILDDGCVEVVAGGASRSASVRAAFKAVRNPEIVVVHDAARPLVTRGLMVGALDALEQWGCAAVVCAVPVTDTVKETDEGDRVLATLERRHLWAVHTPQVFRGGELEAALARVDSEHLARVTDEAQLVEDAGGDVRIFRSHPENIKVTTPVDLTLAELLLARREQGD